jgi:hypothetical protein
VRPVIVQSEHAPNLDVGAPMWAKASATSSRRRFQVARR